jgi:hypothetical protein
MRLQPTFSGEIQLAGWSESHTGGCKVTFWLQSNEDLEAFRALTVRKGNTAGHRFMAALVEIGDDEQPVVNKSLTTEKPKGGALAKLAGMWCNDPEFWAWLETDPDNACHSAQGAAACLYAICGIESRAELDHNKQAAEIFHTFVRGPYQQHLIARGVWRDVP